MYIKLDGRYKSVVVIVEVVVILAAVVVVLVVSRHYWWSISPTIAIASISTRPPFGRLATW